MVYFTPAKAVNALTVSLAVAAFATDAVQARPAFAGADAPSVQIQPQARMQKVVLRSNPPPPLPEGVSVASDQSSRRSFAEQGNYKRSKSKAAAAANRRVFRRSEAGSKRAPSNQVHEHIHIHEYGKGRGRGYGHYRHDRVYPVVLDDRVRHHSVHWAEHHGLLPYTGKGPTIVQIGKKGVTVVNRVINGVPGVSKIISSFPPAKAPAAKSKAAPKAAAPKAAAPKPAAKKPAGKGKRRHDDRYDEEYYRFADGHVHEHEHDHFEGDDHAHIHAHEHNHKRGHFEEEEHFHGHEHEHEHDHEHDREHEHIHAHEHNEKRDQVARITVGNDGQFYRSPEANLLELHLRDVETSGSIDETGTEVAVDTDSAPDGVLTKRRHNSKYYIYDDDTYWRYPDYLYGTKGGNAHVHAHIHSHGGDYGYGRGGRHGRNRGYRHGSGSGSAHVHEHIHVHKRGGPVPPTPADAVTAKVGDLKAGTPLGNVGASDVTGKLPLGTSSGSGPAPAPPKPKKPTLPHPSHKGQKHNLNTKGRPVPAPASAPVAPHKAADGGPTAGAFVDADHLTHTLAERGLLGGLLKPLLAPLNALPGFITISDLLFGDDNVLKKVAALVLHAEPARGGVSAGPGNVLAAAPPYKYSLMSSTDERTQVYLVPAEAPNSKNAAAARQSFAAVMNGTTAAAAAGASADNSNNTFGLTANDTVVVKIVVPLMNATTGLPATWCATFAKQPPSPLELQPCTGAPLASAADGKNGSAAASLAVVPEIAGKSQRFQYTPATGVLSPLYEKEFVGTLKQVMAVKPSNNDGTISSASAQADFGGADDEGDDADEVDFFGAPMNGSSDDASSSDDGLFSRQLAVDTAGSGAGEDVGDGDALSQPASAGAVSSSMVADDADSDLNDPASAGVGGFPDSDDLSSSSSSAGAAAEDGSLPSPMSAKAQTQAPGTVGVQLKFVPAGSWAQQMNAAVSDASSTSTSASSTDSSAATATSTATDSSSATPAATTTDAPTSTSTSTTDSASVTATAAPESTSSSTDVAAPSSTEDVGAAPSATATDAPAPSRRR
ncbi:hypothetical protein OC835_002427 [Tilletia horrida]|nr:hypothetical protein OC835_002427 [Tilletia horrida]